MKMHLVALLAGALLAAACTGSTGPAGPAGPAGPQGPAGAKGADGVAGPTGPEGPAGPAGATGATGASGATGAQGVPGTAGATGPAGAQGAAGRDGDDNLFPDPYFQQGMTSWQLLAGSGSQGSVIPPAADAGVAGAQVFANAPTQVAWVSSTRQVPLNAQHTYEVKGSFRRPTTSGSAGGIYLAVLLFDGAGNAITGDGTWWYYPVSFVQLGDQNWHTYSARFGFGTTRGFPVNAKTMSVGAILNYDGSVAGNRNYEVAGLGIKDVVLAPSENLAADGSDAVVAGSANALYTPVHTLPQGTYLVTFYNCLSAGDAVLRAGDGGVDRGRHLPRLLQQELLRADLVHPAAVHPQGAQRHGRRALQGVEPRGRYRHHAGRRLLDLLLAAHRQLTPRAC